MPPKKKPVDDPNLTVVLGCIDRFCRTHLNEEYRVVCDRMARHVHQHAPELFQTGKPEGWACGIVRIVGQTNFLNDPSQTPHMKTTDLVKAFGVGESTSSAKAAQLRRYVETSPLNHEWHIASRLAANPMIWFLRVNGRMMDIRQAPRDAQVVAFENGFIPFIPADRD